MTDGAYASLLAGASLLLALAGAAAVGFVAGIAYFGALAFTVDRLAQARRPGLLLLVSTLVRMLFVVLVFLALARWAGWQSMLAGLVGLLAARTVLVRQRRR